VESAMKSCEKALKDQEEALNVMLDGISEVMRHVELDFETGEEGFDTIKAGAAAFASAGKKLDGAMENLKDALDSLAAVPNQVTSTLDQFGDAVNAFQAAAWTLTGVMGETEELFEYLASVDPVQIAMPDMNMAASATALYGTFAGMKEEMEQLGGSLNTIASGTAGHIRSINNQFMVVMDTLMSAVYSLQNEGTDVIEDTSDEEIDAITGGKVHGCENQGTVYGDVNVGGVTGTMAVESELDPEDDLEELGSSSMKQTYKMKCILQSCVNYGPVTARKNYVGGGCGNMELGLVESCENYDTITSETGNCTGGIAGAVCSTVRNSLAKSFLSGKDYVGGIAGVLPEGEGGRVENCYAMTEITDCSQYGGAICGGDKGSFSGNYFVSESLAGLNRISVHGEAEPISYKKLKKVKNLPEEFLQFTLTFTEGDTVLKSLPFSYGDSFSGKVYPQLPEKEGYYGVWSISQLENLKFDTVVKAEYYRYVTALESSMKREDGRPVFFAEGQFTGEDRLKADPDRETAGLIQTLVDAAEGTAGELAGEIVEENLLFTEVWTLQIPDDGQEQHCIRYLKPDHVEGSVQLSIMEDGNWKAVGSEEIGSYAVFTVSGNQVQIQAITGVHSSRTWIVLAGIGGAAFLAAAFVLVKLVRRRRLHHTSTTG